MKLVLNNKNLSDFFDDEIQFTGLITLCYYPPSGGSFQDFD